MSRFTSKILIIAALFAFTAALAQDRTGFVSVGYRFPYQIDPETKWSSQAYTIDFSYFSRDFWANVFSFDFGMTQEQPIEFAVGPQFYAFKESTVQPYFSPVFIYMFTPRHDIGWRVSVGAEWNMKAWTGIGNLRFFYDAGLTKKYVESGPNRWSIDIARLGLSWNY